jgi:peptidoglycan/xylan/chitin deacetylase (PgdA/CDA1 family)
VIRRLVVGAAVAWGGYALGAHLLTPGCVWRGPSHPRRLALTFDDGPDPIWTERVLDLLAEHRVRGTFFLVGERAARAVSTVKRMAAAGHEVASHGWSHRSLWLCGPARTDEEIRLTAELLGALVGQAPRHFRPPWGLVNLAMFPALRRYRQRCVFWSVQPEGLRPAPAERQVAHVLAHAHPGAIVDLHDTEGTPGAPARLLAALPPMLAGLREAGYDFVTVGELLAPA